MRRRNALCSTVLVLAATAQAAPPVLEPVNDVGAVPFTNAGFVLAAADPDPGEVLTFELVDPVTGNASPLTAFLSPWPAEPPRQAAIVRWYPSAQDAGQYPLRAIVRDLDGNEDSAEFTVTVYAPDDDITGVFSGPTVVPYNTPERPGPYRYTVEAGSTLGLDLEYPLEYEIQRQIRHEDNSVTYVTYAPYQTSPDFDLVFDEPATYGLRAWVRSAISQEATYLSHLDVTAYTPGDLLPAAAPATAHLVGPGQIAVRWQPHPDNTRVARYRLLLAGGFSRVEETLEVPDPLNEPASYEHVFDFADPARGDLRELITIRNATHVEHSWQGPLWAGIQVEAVDSDETLFFTSPGIDLLQFFPHVTALEVEPLLETKQVRVTLGPIVLPGGYYHADEVRLFWNSYGTEPEDYQVLQAPIQGDALILSDDGGPVPIGLAEGTLYASVVDRTLVSPDVIEGGLLEQEITLEVADCDDGLDNDGDGLVDLGGDPGCVDADDADEYDRSDAFDLAPRALVVYNTNTTDGETIAEHYRAARGLPESALCPVPLPPGSYARAAELEAVIWLVLEECICENVLGRDPEDCVDVLPSTLAGSSPINHLVLIKGIPERLLDTGWTSDDEEPVLGYQLARHLFDDSLSYYGLGGYGHWYSGTRDDSIDHQPRDSIRGNVRPVQPGIDEIVAYGHIVGLDTERTIALIDRTIAAEQAGFRGNVLDNEGGAVFDFFRRLTDSRSHPDPALSCTGYVDDPLIDWPHDRCRAGTTAEGLIPGEPSRDGLVQSIPHPVDVGLYLGTGLPPGGHNAFRGFANMLNWRREHPDDAVEPCVPLCRNHETPDDVAACRAASTDYFREIDTRCVGAAPGFMGWQFRSWPVQYYGIQPPGWKLDTPGDREKTIPAHRTGSPFGDGYVHFGAPDAVDDPVCLLAERGAPPPCPEPIFVSLNLAAAIGREQAATDAFAVRLRYRRGGPMGGGLKVWLDFRREDGETASVFETLDLSQPQPAWTTATVTVGVPADARPLSGVTLRLASLREDALHGWLDLDHVELFDVADPAETNLLPADVADFEAPYLGPTQPGDWAANAIDRLGGIAWWGSSSHHLTNGYAYYESDMFAGAFFGGRTLGEALLFTGNNVRSGIAYGDPLYRPSGARVYLDDGTTDTNGRYVIVGDDPWTFGPAGHAVLVDAFHGQANLHRTVWSVAMCAGADVDVCDATDGWVTLESNADHGVNAVLGHALAVEPLELFDNERLDQDQDVVLRIAIWNPRELEHRLLSYAFVHYKPTENHPPEAADVQILPQQPGATDDLYAFYRYSDVEGSPELPRERTVEWLRDGAAVPALDGATVVPHDRTTEGEHWVVGISVSDGTTNGATAWSPPVTIGCGAPPLPLRISVVNRDVSGGVRFDVDDPNPPGQATGYNLYRGTSPAALALLQADAPDADTDTPGIQLIDPGATPALLFYRVTAFNNRCAAEGP